MRVLCVVAAVVLLAGCSDPPGVDIERSGSPSGEVRQDGEYWLVLVHGKEERTPPPNYSCSVAWSWEHDVETQELRFSPDAQLDNHIHGEPEVIIGTIVWGPGDCPVDNRVTDAGNVTVHSDVLGDVTIVADGDGRVSVSGHVIVPGETLTISGTQRDGATKLVSSIEIEVIGAWPLDGLVESHG